MLTTLAEALAAVLILVGAGFLLVGSFGLAKLPDLMRRLHGPTKATTLGVGATLIGSMIYYGAVRGELSFHEVLITIFLFLTAPVSAQMIAKAHILRSAGARRELPPVASGWGTLEPAPEDDDGAGERPER